MVIVRLIASIVGLLALLVVPALAGDRMQIALIGYSGDSNYFAFVASCDLSSQ
ncbi:MAG: hypothetical protein MO846_09295 [Candidatus Devosia symbiotica]|nr:hypothetical protein [Candidatus Devosia symbiotica]